MRDWYADDDRWEPEPEVEEPEYRVKGREQRQRMKVNGRSVFTLRDLAARPRRKRGRPDGSRNRRSG